MFYFVLYLLLIDVRIKGSFFNNNITDYSKCKVHYSRSGSNYNDFYELNETTVANKNLLVDFHFSVLAPSDAHILLAPSMTIKKTDPAYEIVIGAGGNSFSDIRRKQKSEVKASRRINGLLSALDLRSFWLHISEDGNIEVGKEGNSSSFLSWVDPDPLPVKYISLSTWSGIEAKWYFDCEMQNGTTEIEKPLTENQRLRRDLLNQYNPYVRPVRNASTITTVYMALQIEHISLDEKLSTIEVMGVSRMTWHDEKLRWDPTDYQGMDNLHIFHREIWHPDLALYNAIGDTREILGESYMVARSTGTIEWNPSVNFKSWCNAEDLGTWPKEKHRCNLILGFMQDFNKLRLELSKNESSRMNLNSPEWSILEVNFFSGISKNNISEQSILEIFFTLKRNSNLYEMIFFTPFIVIAVSLLSSFWMDPFGQKKISIACSQLVLTAAMLLVMAIVIPSHPRRVPYLVSLYSYTSVGLVVAIIMTILVINIARTKHHRPVSRLISTIITSKVISVILLLPKMNLCDEYSKIVDTSATKSQEKVQQMWIHLALAIDRIVFWVYSILIAYAIYSNK